MEEQNETVTCEIDTHDVVRNKLIAIGANAASGSYDESHKSALSSFLSSPLSMISPTWAYLRTDLKVRVIDSHKEEFDRFIYRSEQS